MRAKAKPQAATACPFCGLCCDDLEVKIAQASKSALVTAKGCDLAKRRFEAAGAEAPARVDGKKASLEQACERAARILRDSRQPLIGGLATDIAGAKAAIGLADRAGAIVDHAGSDVTFRNVLAMQDKGWIATTLAEVKNRTDLLIVAGTDIVSRFPRFFERCVWNQHALVKPEPAKREIVYLGAGLDTAPGFSPDGRAPHVIDCDIRRLGEVFGALRAVYHGRRLEAGSVGGASLEALGDLVARIKAAHYGVVAWAAADLEGPHGDLAVQAICNLVTDINETSRFSCLPLGGGDNALGAGQAATWQAGFPLRISFARGYPEYDPHLFGWRRLIASGDVDSVLWISGFEAADLPFETELPTVVVGAPGAAFKREPVVYIPVGVPGIDHAGHIARTDAVTSLPLAKLRDGGLPRASDVLAAIEERFLSLAEGS
ncbi:MAG: formylmethanofuran dehydrogenase subunit B [Alphaproteobacteria bacterium]